MCRAGSNRSGIEVDKRRVGILAHRPYAGVCPVTPHGCKTHAAPSRLARLPAPPYPDNADSPLLPTGPIALTSSGNPVPLKAPTRGGIPPLGPALEDLMSHEKSRGHREAKKPKKEKPKVSATTVHTDQKDALKIGGKTAKR